MESGVRKSTIAGSRRKMSVRTPSTTMGPKSSPIGCWQIACPTDAFPVTHGVDAPKRPRTGFLRIISWYSMVSIAASAPACLMPPTRSSWASVRLSRGMFVATSASRTSGVALSVRATQLGATGGQRRFGGDGSIQHIGLRRDHVFIHGIGPRIGRNRAGVKLKTNTRQKPGEKTMPRALYEETSELYLGQCQRQLIQSAVRCDRQSNAESP